MTTIAVILVNSRGGHVKAANVNLTDRFPTKTKPPTQQVGIALSWCMNHGVEPLKDVYDPTKHNIKIRFLKPDEL